ncbi:hypothetical protein R1flu_013645 [Riccia fluitans]|uniref:Uncharacterized protein n=1 Tax=Riccia fluitans TaxID=41844 RepID=A0ABD1YHC2_9MARC
MDENGFQTVASKKKKPDIHRNNREADPTNSSVNPFDSLREEMEQEAQQAGKEEDIEPEQVSSPVDKDSEEMSPEKIDGNRQIIDLEALEQKEDQDRKMSESSADSLDLN